MHLLSRIHFFILALCVLAATDDTAAQPQSVAPQRFLSLHDETCVRATKIYAQLIELKTRGATSSEMQQLIEPMSKFSIAQTSRLVGISQLLDGSEIKERNYLISNYYLLCSLNK